MNQMSPIYRYMTAGIILAFLVAGLATVRDYGMSWDEETRWESGDLKLDYYRALLAGEEIPPERRMAGDRYPGLFDLPLAAFNSTFGGDRMLQGHVLSICFGALGLVATGWLAGIVFGARTAFLSVVILAVLPQFYGHAMINPKDIPFLGAYTLGLATIFWSTRALAGSGSISWPQYALCGLAIGLAGASRIPGLVLLGIAAACWSLTWLWVWKTRGEAGNPTRTILSMAGGLLLSSAIALVVVLVFFPRAQFQLFSSLPEVTGTLHSSARDMPLLFNGAVVNASEGPFAYAHRFLLISTPLWMIALLAAGIIVMGRQLADQANRPRMDYLLHGLFLAAALFPWIYILLTQPALHDGNRHMLFGIPGLVIIMGEALNRAFSRLEAGQAVARNAAAALLAAAVIWQVVHLVRMHPYQYVSFNLLAGPSATLPNRFDAEYWCTSTKHLLEALPEVAQTPARGQPVKIRVSGALDAARPFVPEGFVLVDSFEEADYYVSNTNFRIDMIVDGEVVYELNRGGIPIGVIKRLK
jgi:hypothetical protein